MSDRIPFPLSRQAQFLALISLAFLPAVAQALPAARVEFAQGEVFAETADGTRRPLSRGSEVTQGDTVVVNAGRAQLRFSDGAFISLKPQTSFKVDEYAYSGKTDGKEKGFFSLLRGAMRTVTGAIGRSNQDAYQVKTAYATIGIRGTGYNANLGGDHLTVSVFDGRVALINEGGSLILSTGQTGVVGSPDKPPERTGESGGGNRVTTGGGNTGATGMESVPVPPQPITAPAYLQEGTQQVAVAYVQNCCGSGGGAEITTATFSGGQLLSFVDGGETIGHGTTTVQMLGNDGVVAWGRWTNGTTTVDGSPANTFFDTPGEGFYFVAGIPTADMPATGVSTYSMIGATPVVSIDGGSHVGTFSGGLTVDFSAGANNPVQASFTLNMGVDGSASFTTNSSCIGTGGCDTTYRHLFQGNVAGSGALCGSGCSGSFDGAFFGAQASRAGMKYGVSTDIGSLGGGAVFTKTSTTPSPPMVAH